MNPVITRDSLLTLEAYAKARPAMRAKVLEEKQLRRVFLGEHVLLLFENELLIRYQIQEMLRVEKTYEEAGIQAELEAYNPLISDGSDLKATMQIEYTDEVERARMLVALRGIERRVWMRVAGCDAVFAIADEDMSRENEHKTAAVHFLRFAFSAPMIAALKAGAMLATGVDHPQYQAEIASLPEPTRLSLVADLR
jgi:hypothetical protein